jgi:hypothetical protein
MNEQKQLPAIMRRLQKENILYTTAEMEELRSWLNMGAPNLIPVVATKDDSGHWYVIPANMAEEFSELLNISIGESEKAQESEEQFIEKFSQYMTGGELNNTQLYIKSTTPVDSQELHSFDQSGEQVVEKMLASSDPDKIERVNIPVCDPLAHHHHIDVSLFPKQPHKDNPIVQPQFPRFIDKWGPTPKQPLLPTITADDVYAAAVNIINEMRQSVKLSAVDSVVLDDFLSRITAPKKPGALEMVEEFHQAFHVPVFKTPVIPTEARRLLRYDIMREELQELDTAMLNHDMVEILDGLCDLLYTVYGTAHEYGLGPILKPALAEVHRSNMSKQTTGENGKAVKGPNFTPPDLAGIIHNAFPLEPHPAWNTEIWREACDKAIKEGYQGQYEKAVKESVLSAPEISPEEAFKATVVLTQKVESINVNIEFKPTFTDYYERQVLSEQPPVDIDDDPSGPYSMGPGM